MVPAFVLRGTGNLGPDGEHSDLKIAVRDSVIVYILSYGVAIHTPTDNPKAQKRKERIGVSRTIRFWLNLVLIWRFPVYVRVGRLPSFGCFYWLLHSAGDVAVMMTEASTCATRCKHSSAGIRGVYSRRIAGGSADPLAGWLTGRREKSHFVAITPY